MTSHAGDQKASIPQRLREEIFKYGIASGYLFVSFSVLLIYEVSVAGGGHEVLPFGIALVKALVFGKFLLIGDAMKVGSRFDSHPLVYRVASKTLAFLAVLLVFTSIEELLVGWVHGKSAGSIVEEVMQRTWLENLSPVLAMLLILIPLIAISESYRRLGPAKFRELWLGRS
jgi:hypothetical protein